MINRAAALLVLLYALGFLAFAFTLGRPAPADAAPADAAVVLTGGSGRIEHGMAVLRAGKAKRMLVSGVDPSVTKADLARRLGRGSERLLDCCVDLDSVPVDTHSNAEETGRWLAKSGYRSFRLITSDWHMRRAVYEFERGLSKRYAIQIDAVRTSPSFVTLFEEYNKYVLLRLAVWADL